MTKQNCWEFKNCGRQPGGARTHELGICPAATDTAANGIHGGSNGGRACWGIVGTLCEGQVQDTMVDKLRNCVGCDFHAQVEREEGSVLSPREIWACVK
jgi:hypothetical protein